MNEKTSEKLELQPVVLRAGVVTTPEDQARIAAGCVVFAAPTPGRIVLFCRVHDAKHIDGPIVEEAPAMVTSINPDGSAQLRVFSEVGEDLRLQKVPQAERAVHNHWRFPPRV